MLRRAFVVLFSSFVILHSSSAEPAAPVAFRIDGGDEKLPWFRPKPGEFPPEGSAHYIGGELIALDHINRTGTIRLDRTDAIPRGNWDQPLPFTLVPYGSLSFHGVPAELRDVPIGTHLHGLFYLDEKAGKDAKGPFSRAFRLEDDFSFHARQQRTWRVDAVDLEKGTLTVTGVAGPKKQPDAKSAMIQVNAATRVWKGRSLVTSADLAAGQSILMNLTVCTLKGPGRATDIWLDAESREVARAHQLEVHRQFQREHGLAGWIDEVDNQQGIVTVTLFDGFDPWLREDFGFAAKGSLSAAVAEESLRTYDQINDRMRGDILDVQTGPSGPGNSGVRISFKPQFLLEGFRPKRFVRLFSGKWKVDDLPKEERLYR